MEKFDCTRDFFMENEKNTLNKQFLESVLRLFFDFISPNAPFLPIFGRFEAKKNFSRQGAERNFHFSVIFCYLKSIIS